MFSNSRRSTRTNRSRNNRFSKKFSIESLERRELLAANLFADNGIVQSADDGSDTQPVAVSTMTTTTDDGPVISPIAARFLLDRVRVPTTGTIYIDPPPPPELGATFENGVLTVTGSDQADNLFIYAKDGMVHVQEVVKELTLLSVPLAELNSIVVNANGGNDWVSIDDESINIPATMRGGWGNDTLLGGAAGDNLSGDSGNDEIVGRAGNDSINGDSGDDLLIGGDGNDVIRGGLGNDYLVGGNGNDWMMGDEGNDQMFGEAGNDVMFGGPGQNTMDGGAGDDMMYGGEDIDAMYGGEGDDFLRGFGGDDQLRGEGGHDNIMGDAGNDLIDGGDGDDSISGDNGNDVISGDDGNDIISGGNDQDWIDGRGGNDVLHGGAGNDWVSGGAGADQVDGGTGDNQVSQDYPDGYVQYGVITQSLSWGDIVDAAEAVGDFIVDVIKWTVDKAESIGLRFYEWASKLDNRLFRLGGDLASALSNWPWEADFWKGLGRSVIDTLEIFGLGEVWEIAFEILKPWQRGMTSEEIALASSVFGNSIPWNQVRLDEHSLMAWIGRTHVTGYIINSTDPLDDRTLIHELTHVWQYVTDGLVYIPEAIAGQSSDEGYEYGGPTDAQKLADLQAKIAAGQGLSAYNPEQQGEIVADYFELRREARDDYEAHGLTAPLSLRQKLDVYIHFVKEVSTLTPDALDTPNPVIFTPPTVGDIGTITTATKSPSSPTPTPVIGTLDQDLILDAAFAELTDEPSTSPVSKDLELTTSKLNTAPLTTRSLDLAFASSLDGTW